MTSPRKSEPGPRNRVNDHDGEAGRRREDGAPGASGGIDVDAVWKALDIENRVERSPFGMVAAAAGIGFVIGGGLFRPFAARLLRMGLRAAILPLAEQALARLLVRVGTEDAGPTPSEN